MTQDALRQRRPVTGLARLSLALALGTVAFVAVAAGLSSLAMLAVGLVAAVVSLVAAYWFLSRRGALRWLSLALFAAAPLAVIVVYALHSLLWVALVAAAGWLLAGMTARAALARDRGEWRMPEYPVREPARHPFLIMNPKSGGGKVGRFDLQRAAQQLGAEVFLLSGPEPVDIAAVARAAVARGADLLGVAGGDGTQALVAGIAAEHGIPFMVITAGTRNHFALDLGLDRSDPVSCLGALSDAVELRIDLGVIGGRTFVNNASFGAYAEVVEHPAYRGDKLGTTLELLPDLLQGHRGARLAVHANGTQISAPQALLVANNPYGTGDIAGLSRRARLDGGVLGVVAVTVRNAREAAGLLHGRHAAGLCVLTAREVTVTADTRQLPVGVDGEAVFLPVPVRCAVRPGALRVRVPRDRPGVPAPKPELDWARLRHLAGRGRAPRPVGPRQADDVLRPSRQLASGLPRRARDGVTHGRVIPRRRDGSPFSAGFPAERGDRRFNGREEMPGVDRPGEPVTFNLAPHRVLQLPRRQHPWPATGAGRSLPPAGQATIRALSPPAVVDAPSSFASWPAGTSPVRGDGRFVWDFGDAGG